MIADGVTFLVSLLTIIVLSHRLDFGKVYTSPFQPAGEAFSIWLFIFGFLLYTSYTLIRLPNASWHLVALSCTSFISCALWTYWYRTNKGVWIFAIATAFALLASITGSLVPSLTLLDRVGLDLYAGWLTVAMALSVSIHAKEYADLDTPPWLPVPFVISGALISTFTGSPTLAVPLVWTGIFSSSWPTALLFLIPGIYAVATTTAQILR
jgi:multisubunit Na+/H+ antiporter MnhF subunit